MHAPHVIESAMCAFGLNSQIGVPPAYATSRQQVTAFTREHPFGGILIVDTLLHLLDKVEKNEKKQKEKRPKDPRVPV